MKILLSSNAPWAGTGYGVQCAGIARGIRDLGHTIAIHAWWGLQGGSLDWEGIRCFPGQFDGYGNDAAAYLCRHWHADVLITLIDLWVLDSNLGHMGHTRWTPYFPIDHADPIPPSIAERFPHAHRLLVYSRYAEREVKAYDGGKYAEKVRYLPHGVDCSKLYPATDDDRRMFRRHLYGEWPVDSFVVGMVAANKGYPCRKSFPEAFEAFARFHARHPEARLYVHTVPTRQFEGPDLRELAKHFGIQDEVRFPQQQRFLGGDFDDQLMRQVYCSFDVLLSPSQGEGFGLPILEAQAAGIPVIVTDHSAMTELVGAGWKVPPLRLTPSLIGGKYAEADIEGITKALEECFTRPRSYHWTEQARTFALGYSWERVMHDYWAPVLAELDGGRRGLALELVRAHKAS